MNRRLIIAFFLVVGIMGVLAFAGQRMPEDALFDKDFLQNASEQKMLRAIEMAGGNANVRNNRGTPALHYAVDAGNPENVQILLNAGADVNGRDIQGDTALIQSPRVNFRPEIIQILLNAGADVNAQNGSGETALMWAARYSESETVKLLLDAGANLELRENEEGNTALMWAARYSESETVKLLLDAGADVSASKFREDPLVLAVIHNLSSTLSETVKLLLDAGLDMNAQHMRDPLICLAAQYADGDTVALLIRAGANVNEKCGDVTPLMIAAQYGRARSIAALLDAGADVNAQGGNGQTALKLSVGHYDNHRNTDAVKVLLEAGADPLSETQYHPSAWDIANMSHNRLFTQTDAYLMLSDARFK
jgi:ankyrin repeat protein